MRASLAIALASVIASAQPFSITIQAPPANGPASVGATYAGAAGRTPIYYWVIARTAAGRTAPSQSAVAVNTPGAQNLSVSNVVTITWTPVSDATGYDVIRATTPVFPAPCVTTGCAVITNTPATGVTDTGAALSIYTGPAVIGTTQAAFSINNTREAQPFINVALADAQLRMALIEGTPAEDDCLKYASGRVRSAGASCGTGAGGSIVAGPSGGLSVTGTSPAVVDITPFICLTTDVCEPTGSFDLSGAAATKPMKTGTTLPVSCVNGEYFHDSDAASGQNTYACVAGAWVLQGGGSGPTQTDALVRGPLDVPLIVNGTQFAPVSNRVYCANIFADHDMTVGNIVTWQVIALAGGDTRGAFYSQAGNLLNSSSAAVVSGNTIRLPITQTLVAGTTYTFCIATNDASVRFVKMWQGQNEEALYNLIATNFFHCNNTMSGTTMPPTCGVKTAIVSGGFPWFGIAQ